MPRIALARVISLAQVLIIAALIIFLTMVFEWLRKFLEDHLPQMMDHIVTTLFGELTVLGFIAVFLFFLLKSGFLNLLSEKLYHEDHHLVELFEEVHFDLFFVMLVFLAQTLLLVNSLMRSINKWHQHYRVNTFATHCRPLCIRWFD